MDSESLVLCSGSLELCHVVVLRPFKIGTKESDHLSKLQTEFPQKAHFFTPIKNMFELQYGANFQLYFSCFPVQSYAASLPHKNSVYKWSCELAEHMCGFCGFNIDRFVWLLHRFIWHTDSQSPYVSALFIFKVLSIDHGGGPR